MGVPDLLERRRVERGPERNVQAQAVAFGGGKRALAFVRRFHDRVARHITGVDRELGGDHGLEERIIDVLRPARFVPFNEALQVAGGREARRALVEIRKAVESRLLIVTNLFEHDSGGVLRPAIGEFRDGRRLQQVVGGVVMHLPKQQRAVCRESRRRIGAEPDPWIVRT